MGLEFLVRVRRTSLGVGGVAALMSATYAGPIHGLAVSLGVLWSLANLFFLQVLIVALTGPDRGQVAALRRATLGIAGLLSLFAIGALLLRRLPPAGLLAGFLLPQVVIVLKALSLLLLGSKAWKQFTSDARRPGRMLLILAIAASAAAPIAWATATATSGADSLEHPAPATEHTGAHGAASGGEHGGGSQGPEKFANVITVLSRAFPDAGWAHFLHQFEAVFFSVFIAALLCLIAYFASRNAKLIPGNLQNVVETVVERLYDFIISILGPKHGPRYVPFLGSLFIYILVMNLFGLIPFMDSPTSNLNVTFALAIVVFLYAQWIGLRELGIVGYLDHLAGNPRTPLSWFLVPLMLPIHVMGELAKPISLSCRLFGNIFGEDMLLVAFVSLGITVLSFAHVPFGIPLHLPFLFLALLTGTLQALVFTVLSTIYFLLMLPHDEHAHEEETVHAHSNA